MELIPTEIPADHLVIALGSEEALILLQPGGMLRLILDAAPTWNAAARFLTYPKSAAGMLAVLPRAAGSAILKEPARHTVEQDFKRLLFRSLSEGERPPFNAA